jgi:PAS domain S-box-containing protein
MQRRLNPTEKGPYTGHPPPANSFDAGLEGVAGRVFAARVRLLYSGLRLLVVGNLANAAILATVHRNVVEAGILLGWLGFFLASIVWRIVLTRWFAASSPDNDTMPVWARRYVLATAWTGVAWGLAGIFMLPDASPAHQIVTAFVLGGVAAGAVTTLSPVFSAYVAFVVPTLIPVAIQFLLMGGETGYGMAAMYALFLAYLLKVGLSQYGDLGRTQQLAIEKESLVVDLTRQKAVAEALNTELRQQVAEREGIAADLREREASLANAQRIAGLASWDWDLQTNEIRGSEEAYRIFAIDRDVESITFEDFMKMVHPDDRDAVARAVRQTLDHNAIYSVEHRAIAADGSARILHQRGEVVFDSKGKPVRMSGTSHDITDQHRTREELRAASLRAEEANQAKSRFLANMSHEFRTPLNAIIGYSEILKEDAIEQGQIASVTDLERIKSAGRHLLAMVNEVLDLSKIEAGKTELFIESFDVQDMVEEAVATVRSLVEANNNRLKLHCESPLGRMAADAVRVRQMLYNLLSNAGKFTENGEVRVTVRRISERSLPKLDGWIVIAVSDTGIGMRSDRVESAFEAFGQLDPSTTRRHGGTGLGLAITKHYCEIMGGAISVESKPGEGSTFTLRLPTVVTPAELDSAPAGS